MSLDSRAGQPATPDMLTNIPRLVSDYYTRTPDMAQPSQRVSFGTSGHRGTSSTGSFNQMHILAISQAICEYRAGQGIEGPLFLGMDTHALSEPAQATALEVFAANGVAVRVAAGLGYTPTPVVSHAILGWNRAGLGSDADGVIITPSHNPPTDGGFKYNPPTGGPADTSTTRKIQDRANALLMDRLAGVKRMALAAALASGPVTEFDFATPYIDDLDSVIDMEAIRKAGIRIGVDPMGGAGIRYWEPIAEKYGLDLEVVNARVDPTFSFMRVDHDGKIRMDCSSPYAMAGLIDLKDRFDIAFGNDPDFDRHGIVAPSVGLLNPNHFLSVAIAYLFTHRPGWPADARVGKTLVSSSMIDRVAADLGRELAEVPVGFKWFVEGLLDGGFGFGGEESAGASFLRKDGAVWSTDKDGIILALLAAEITAVTGRDPGLLYQELEAKFGRPVYQRMDVPARPEQKQILAGLSADDVRADTLAGDPIVARLTRAPANNAAIGGLKVVTDHSWFAARPSGTENIYKIYAESFRGPEHLQSIQQEAQAIVASIFGQD